MTETESKLRDAVRDLETARKRLHADFPERNFTLDGNLVGDIGEAYAKAHFSLEKIARPTTLRRQTDVTCRSR